MSAHSTYETLRQFADSWALLAMTFPLLVVFSQFLDFWPLRRR